MQRPSTLVAALRAHATTSPDAVALIGSRGVVDCAGLWRRVAELAAWLRSRRIELAGLWGDNSIEWIVADLAAWHAGVTLVPLPAFFSPAQLRHVLQSTGLRHVLACGTGESVVPAVAVEASPVDGVRLEVLAPATSACAIPRATRKITFTSGTTGTPKGVCLPACLLEAVTRALAARIHQAPRQADALRVHFALLPLSTLLENVAGVYVPLLLGRSVVARAGSDIGLHGSSQLDVAQLVRALHREQPHSLIVLPQILRALVVAAERGLPPPASLRYVAVGGAPTPAALITHARSLGIPAYEGYGLSECASVVALNAPSADRVGSVGRVLEHVRVRIEGGAIRVAGNVFPGYLGEQTPERAEWLDTGDLGHLDDDGFLYVTGRRKNVIVSSYGRNVSPEWLEAELSLQPSIAQVMVIGDAQPFLSAIVVPAVDSSIDEVARDIAGANTRLPDYARVRRFIVASESFSRANACLTDNGRPRRDAIAARYTNAIAALYADHASTTESGSTHDVL